MNLKSVLFEGAIIGECGGAVRAKVRPNARVDAKMFLQRVSPSKRLVAHVILMLGFLVDLGIMGSGNMGTLSIILIDND